MTTEGVCKGGVGLLALTLLGGCIGPQVHTVRLTDAMSRELREDIRVYQRAELRDVSFERLGATSAVSCKHRPWDAASEEDAVDQIRYQASLAGGTGITDVSCENETFSIAKNCWRAYTCYAGIIRASTIPAASASGRMEMTAGTGIAVSREGDILTNSHLVAGAKAIIVTVGGEVLQAVLVREDPINDLAILKVDRKTVPLAFRDDSRVRAGDFVTVLGYPLSSILSKEPHVSTGSISALTGLKDDLRLLQFSAPVQPGNSGGPVLDEAGRVIGISVDPRDVLKAVATSEVSPSVNFAVKSSIARAFMDAAEISYVVSQQATPRSPADIADAAREGVVYVERR